MGDAPNAFGEFIGPEEGPDIAVEPPSLNFGTVRVGKSKIKSLRIRNEGTGDRPCRPGASWR